MAIQSTIMLNNGTVIPQVGLGVFQTPDGDTTVNAVQTALENSYRHIDTAMIYRNEASVGEGIRRAGVPRSDFFLTTKLWNDDIRARRGKDAFQESLDRLGVDYAHGILPEAWSPLGGTGGNLLSNPVLAEIGAKYGKSAAQVVIRWHIQRGIIVLPKSTHAERIKQNFEVFDFNLSVDDMTAISAINTGKRNGADPDNFNF